MVLGSSVLFLLMMLAENRKACSSALITCVLGPSVYSKIPPGTQKKQDGAVDAVLMVAHSKGEKARMELCHQRADQQLVPES